MNSLNKILALCIFTLLLISQQVKLSKTEILPLYGEFIKIGRPAFTLKTFLDGSYQKIYEQWFSESLPYRNVFIRTENSLNYHVFNEISPAPEGNAVILGVNDTLCEKSYINAYNGVSEIKRDRPHATQYSTQQSAEKLARVSTVFNRLGKYFVFLFYPQKAAIYPELIKEKWKIAGGAENSSKAYQTLQGVFKSYQIPYVDGAHLFKGLKKDFPKIPLYPKGGTHWNYFGACHVLNAMLSRANEQQMRVLPNLNCQLGGSHQPGVRESDIARITNLWSDSQFNEAILDVNVSATSQMSRPPLYLFYEGTSFSGELYNMLRSSGIAALESPTPGSYYHTGAKSNFDWDEDFMKKTDWLILEQSQASYLTRNVMDFIDDIEKNSLIYQEEVARMKAQQISLHIPNS